MSGLPVAAVGVQEDLDQIALEAARSGASAIRQVLAAGELETSWKSGDHDLVTAADRSSEQAVLGVLQRLRPRDAILGEETGEHPGSTGLRWLIDPLDATVNFVHGRAGWAVSVGAEVADRPVAGAIVCPGDGRWAAVNGDRIVSGGYDLGSDRFGPVRPPQRFVRQSIAPDQALVSLGQPYDLAQRYELMGIAQALSTRVRGLRLTGAAASELLGVAGGDADAYVSFALGPWDTAAGAAMVLACGGVVEATTTPSGMPVLVIARADDLARSLVAWVSAPVTDWDTSR